MNGDREPIDWDRALWLHEQAEWTFAAIAREYGYAYKTVRQALTKRGASGRRPARHGKRANRLRELWRFMWDQCSNPRHASYRHYGARGVAVSPVWDDFEAFYAWAQSSGYRLGLRLMLRDGCRFFAPENCHWVTVEERIRLRRPPKRKNRRRKPPKPIDWELATRLYLDDGLSQPEVARRVGASYVGIVTGFKRMHLTRPRESGPTGTAEGKRLHKC